MVRNRTVTGTGQAQRRRRKQASSFTVRFARIRSGGGCPQGIQLSSPVATSRSHSRAVTNRLSPNCPGDGVVGNGQAEHAQPFGAVDQRDP